MSLTSDIETALLANSPVPASGKIYLQVAPQDIELPFVVYRILNKDPLTLLQGDAGLTKFSVAFDCYADDYLGAMNLRAAVKAATDAWGLISFPESAPGEEYILDIDGFADSLYLGIWHS